MAYENDQDVDKIGLLVHYIVVDSNTKYLVKMKQFILSIRGE
jgi:hypothetical protein